MLDMDFSNGQCMNGHDWAIIEVEKPIEFNINVRPICLPKPYQEIYEGLIVPSWGRHTCKVHLNEKKIAFSFGPKSSAVVAWGPYEIRSAV